MAADGSVVIETRLNIKQVDKDLAKLKGKIEKTEKDIASFQKERDAARGKSTILGADIENEQRKLEALKSDLLGVKSILKDNNVHRSMKEEAEWNLPKIQEDIKAQQEHVRLLRAEFNKLKDSVDRYDKKIESSNASLSSMKEEAGSLERGIAAAAAQTQKLADESTVSNQHIVDLSRELEELQAKMDSLKEAGIGVGYEEYDKTAARIKDINSELKKYNAGLSKTGKSKKQVSSTADAFNKLSKRIRSSAAAALRMGGKAAYSGIKKLGELAKKAATSFYNLFRNEKRADRGFSFSLKSMLRYSLGIESLFTAVNKMREGITDGIKNLVQVSDSTNQSVSSLLSSLTLLKNSLATAFAPILEIAAPILTKFIDMLASASDHVARLFARLSGKTSYKKAVKVQQNYAESLKDTSKSAKDGADGIEGIADSAEDAEESIEESEKAMASFDEINQLVFQEDKKRNEKDKEEKKKDTEGLEDEIGKVSPEDMFEDVEIEPLDFSSWGEAFNAFLDYLLNNGIPALQNSFSLFADWLNGFSSNLYEMLTFPGVQEKVALLGTELANAFNGLVDMINWHLIGQALGAGINTALNFIVNFVRTFNWTGLGQSIASFLNGAVSEINWSNVGEFLASKFKIALDTLAGFILGLDMPQLAKAASDLVMGFFDTITSTIQGIHWADVGNQIATFLSSVDWPGVFMSVGKAISTGVNALFTVFSKVFNGVDWRSIGVSIGQALNQMINDIDWELIGTTIGGFFVSAFGFLSGAIETINWIEFGAKVQEMLVAVDWATVARAAFEALGAAFGAVVGTIIGAIGETWKSVVDWWHEVAFEDGEFTIAGLLAGILEALANIAEWIGENIIYPFIEGFRAIFDDMEGIGADIINSLLNGLKSAWETVVGFLNDAAEFIKSIFGGAKDEVSSVASANIGSGRYATYSSYSAIAAMPAISTHDIPQLAAGAVIPPNREFLAVLGDQQSGTNIEAPEDLIRRIVREESGNAQDSRILEQILEAVRKGFVMELDGNKIGRLIYSSYNKENKRVGVSLVNGVR